jgi:hypothetical protein
MSVRQRNVIAFDKLSMPVSYMTLDKNRLYDARNVFDNKGITETRNGLSRYNLYSIGTSTNIFTFPIDFDNAVYTKQRSSITADALESPDGTITADKLVENTATNTHYVQQSFSAIAGLTSSISVYIKAGERTSVRMRCGGASFIGDAYFNLSTGVVTTSTGSSTGSITSIGNSWYLCRLTTPHTVTETANVQIHLAQGTITISYTGDGVSGLYVWGLHGSLDDTTSVFPSPGESCLSISYFKKSDGTRYKIVKAGTSIYSVSASGTQTAIKTGLSSTTKHRGITLDDRHIIAVESDGLYSFNGTTFTQLGQAPPTTLTAAISTGGSLTSGHNYQAAITFYASSIGFETNPLTSSVVSASGADLQVSLSGIPSTASNALIDKVRIYLKDVSDNSSYLYITEISLGTTTYIITTESTSTQTPPTTNAAPVAGGGKYLTNFGKCIAYTGNSTFKNDVFISEEYLPDAYNDTTTAKTLSIPGQGENTGIACGLYNNSYLDPYLVIFKKTSTTIYSELNGTTVQTTIDDHVGCVSHDTIKVRNGDVYFMSENGWYYIHNGAILKKDEMPFPLGEGKIDDIFSREGWSYQLNAQNFSNFFSVYYSTLGHYMTFVCEGGNNSFYKAYNFEERIGGFRVYEFKIALTCGCEGEDDNGNQCVFLGDTKGFIYTLSVKNDRSDDNQSLVTDTIPAYLYLPFSVPGDDSLAYHWRTFVVKAISSSNDVTVRAFPSYSVYSGNESLFDFSNDSAGFILDLSQLDIGVLGDERVPKSYTADLNTVGEVMVIGFFQDIADANIGLISSQLSYRRHGNNNL